MSVPESVAATLLKTLEEADEKIKRARSDARMHKTADALYELAVVMDTQNKVLKHLLKQGASRKGPKHT